MKTLNKMKKIVPLFLCFALTGCTWHADVKHNTHTWATSSPDFVSTVPYWIHFNF